MLMGSILLVPGLAMGIAQQDPANPVAPAEQQRLQQETATKPDLAKGDVVGVIAEVREDSFSVRKDSDQSVVWFSLTPELKSSYSSELVTGNHVRVAWMPGDSPDRMMASTITAEAGDTRADLEADTETDLDADVDVDSDSATATLDSDTEIEDDARIAHAETDTSLREDSETYDSDSDELPATASSLPTIATFGLLALLGAVAVAFARRF
jgi:hypothetical protein